MQQPCYATPSFHKEPRFDDVQLIADDGWWFGQLQLVFEFTDICHGTCKHQLALIKEYEFVDVSTPECPVYGVPYVKKTDYFTLVNISDVDGLVELMPDRTCDDYLYVETGDPY